MKDKIESYLSIARREAAITAQLERAGHQIWDVVNSPAHYYESTFHMLLRELPGGEAEHPLEGVIAKRKQEFKRVFVMDVMGQGRFYASGYPVDGEVANALTTSRNEIEQQIDRKHNMEFIPGDITEASTQEAIDTFIRTNNMNGGFDFIFCRPKMGWSVVIPDTHAGDYTFVQYMQWYIANTLYKRLSPQNGSLFIDYSWHTTNPTPLIEAISSDPKIVVSHDIKRMRITRSLASPSNLPFPPITV